MTRPQRSPYLKVPCGQVLGHGEFCVKGHLCDQCDYIIALELYISSLDHKESNQDSRFIG